MPGPNVVRDGVRGGGIGGAAQDRAAQGRVAYVIIAYRSERDLAGCLDAIAADALADPHIIVVDNASPDSSADIARGHPSAPVVVRSDVNGGFGSGCNLGAQSTDREYLFFVNPDARIAPGATAALVDAADAEPEVAALGPFILGPGGDSGALNAGFEPSLRSMAGHFLFVARLPFVGRWFPPLQLRAGLGVRYPDWVSGAAMMVRRDAFQDVGGFDQSLFMYMEDVDLCRRLRERGSRIRYVPEVEVSHALGGSQGEDQAERWYRALHAYLVKRRGAREARASALCAWVGLSVRALILRQRNPALARRLARSARCAGRLAIGRRASDYDGW